MKKKNMLTSIVLILFFIAVSILFLFPLYYLVMASFKPADELFRNGLDFSINLDLMNLNNYRLLFTDGGGVYLSWYKNSLLITALYTGLGLFLSSMVGYGLGAYQFKGRNFIFLLVLFVLMMPVEILMLPLYKLMISLGMINKYSGVILPFVVSPIAVFFFRQFVSGLPKDFIDAGRIDGCTEIGIFFRIMVPLMAPAFGAMGILLAMQSWHNFIWPLIVLRTNEMLTLPIGLASMLTPYGNNYDKLIAGSVLAIIPIIIVFLFNQRAFISGLTAGGVKG